MSAKYKELKKQIESLKRFQEITKAIRFVAGGELARLRKRIDRRRAGLVSFVPLFRLGKKASLKEVPFDNFLVISIGEDRGSCGAHNMNVVNATLRLLDWFGESGKAFSVYCIGKKIKTAIKNFYRNNLKGFIFDFGDVRFSIDNCYYMTKQFMNWKFDQCYLLFNRYFSVGFQKSMRYRICNYKTFVESILNRSDSGKHSVFFNSFLEHVDNKQFLKDIYRFGFTMFLLDALEDNRYSFLASRFNAMDTALTNSKEILSRVVLAYCKARQEYITTELTEIVTCAEVVSTTSNKVQLEDDHKSFSESSENGNLNFDIISMSSKSYLYFS